MLYVVYSTSNSDYQSWQCKLLEWSFKKVQQPGKLIRLCSFNTHEPNREFDESSISEVIKLPDYRTRWTNYTKNKDKDYGIVNKTESLKYWLKNYKGLSDDDNVLFIDPDMVFQKKIELETKQGVIIGQRWIDTGAWESVHFKKYANHIINKINSESIFMYPYLATVGDLKKIVDKYTSLCYEMRIDNYPHLWESEMFSLIISSLEKVIVKTIPNFGLCITWNYNPLLKDKNFVDECYLLHYPGDIYDVNKKKIFNKQDYTPLTLSKNWSRIDINNASSYIERKFLSILDNYNLEKVNRYYWENPDLIDAMKDYNELVSKNNKYVLFKPWSGGFNNIRMSLEMAASIAYLTNRILVLPPSYNMYLLKNKNDFSNFFDVNDFGIQTISFEEFKNIFYITDWKEAETISYVITENSVDTVYYINNSIEEKKPIENGRKLVNFSSIKNETILFFKENLLGNFYLNIRTDEMPNLKKYISRHIHYKKEIFNEASKIVEILNKNNYYALHVRRGDFQYKDLVISCEEIYNNIKNVIPHKSKLYISTDEKDKSFFQILVDNYDVYFFEDVKHKIYKDINEDLIGPIEQIVCANAKMFIGNKLSTFSSYIYRLRGYLNDIPDKSYRTYQHECFIEEEEPYWWMNSWAREYDDAWKDIENIHTFNVVEKKENIFNKRIFVSIASYRDPQLVDTINSLLTNKSSSNEVMIGVCMQDTEENFDKLPYKNHPNVVIYFAKFEESKGVGWARNIIQQQLYKNEDYYLQIDSHTRVCKDWDKILIQQLNNCDTHKAILSTYPNGFDITDTTESYFLHNTCPYLKISSINDNKKMNLVSAGVVEGDKPILGFWVAAGFFFTRGEWVKDVTYSKDFYFAGEEDYISLKSFEKGWDVYVPDKSTVWHDYTDTRMQSPKKYRPLHWEDHKNIEDNLYLLEELYLISDESSIRTPDEFLKRAKEISNYTDISRNIPILDKNVSVKINGNHTIDIELDFDWNKIPNHDVSKEVNSIIFAFETKKGLELYRPDIYDREIINRTKNLLTVVIDKNIYEQIYKCIWFYFYQDGSFGDRMEFNILKHGNKFYI